MSTTHLFCAVLLVGAIMVSATAPKERTPEQRAAKALLRPSKLRRLQDAQELALAGIDSDGNAVGMPKNCTLPCILQNGCICDGTKPHRGPDGQYYGTCSSCTVTGFSGWNCGSVVQQCFNGGVFHNVSGKASCTCPYDWQGPECGDRVCMNSVGGTGPHDEVMKGNTNFCDKCKPGYGGINCGMCSSDDQCPLGTHCNSTMIAQGTHKTFYCNLTEATWLELLGNGRDIEGRIEVKFEDPYGFWMPWKTTTAYLSMWRIEPNRQWIDPFFYGTLRNCSMEITYEDPGHHSHDPIPHHANPLKTTIPIPAAATNTRTAVTVLIGICIFVISANGVTRDKRIKIRVFQGATAVLFLLVVFFILFSCFYGIENQGEEQSNDTPTLPPIPTNHSNHTEAPPTPEPSKNTTRKGYVTYKCETSKASCAPNPANYSYQPRCIGSILGNDYIPIMLGSSYLKCDFEGNCEYVHSDLGNTPIDLKCVAAECTSSDRFSHGTDEGNIKSVASAAEISSGILGGIIAIIFLHWLYDRYEARKIHKRFREMFSSSHQQPATINTSLISNSSRGSSKRLFGDPSNLENTVLRVNDVGYSVHGGTKKEILKGVNLCLSSGQTMALMGASGAGKTTLLDILAAREKAGEQSGELTINGKCITPQNASQYRRMTGYVAQEETLIPALTVRETILYAARLKLPSGMPDHAVEDLVDDVIAKLHLKQCEHTMVGDEYIRGISGGEKRRVSIATELVANPRILFLDEPTSGLDSYSAQQVMEAVVNLTKQPAVPEFRAFFSFKPMVIFSIHQPSSDIYKLFDRVLLLSQGEILYIGEAARALDHVVNVTRMKPPCPTSNPAEVLLQLQHTISEQERDLLLSTCGPGGHTVLDSDDMAQVMDINEESLRYYPTVWEQFHLLCRRSFSSLIGSYYLIAAHAAAALVVGLILSFLYRHEKLDLAGTEDKAGMLTFLLLVIAFSSISILELFIAERKLFVLERENGYYGTLPYFVTKVLFDYVPLRIIPTLVLSSIIYFPMGLRTDGYQYFLWFVGICVTFSLFVTGLCLCIAMVAPSFGSGALFCSLVILWNTVFGGLMIQSQTIPIGFKYFKFGSPFYFAFEALMVNELDGLACIFDPANNEGRSAEVKVPILCRQFLYNLGLNPENFRRDIGLLCGWVLVTLVVAFLLLRFFVRLKR